MKLLWQKVKDFVVYGVLHADDTPHRIALGVAIGIFVTFTPTLGFQMILVAVIATLLRANKFVGLRRAGRSTFLPASTRCAFAAIRAVSRPIR